MRKKLFVIAVCVLLVATVICLTACNKQDEYVKAIIDRIESQNFRVHAYNIQPMTMNSTAINDRYYSVELYIVGNGSKVIIDSMMYGYAYIDSSGQAHIWFYNSDISIFA